MPKASFFPLKELLWLSHHNFFFKHWAFPTRPPSCMLSLPSNWLHKFFISKTFFCQHFCLGPNGRKGEYGCNRFSTLSQCHKESPHGILTCENCEGVGCQRVIRWPTYQNIFFSSTYQIEPINKMAILRLFPRWDTPHLKGPLPNETKTLT